MGKRVVIIAAAVALAAGLVLVTLLSDTPAVPAPASELGTSVAAPQAPRLTADDLAQTPDRPETGPIATGQYRVERLSRGKLWQFWGERVTPLPQGLIRVDEPGMRLHLEPWRVMQITARTGTFVAPDNQPRSGDFEGQVIVTLFESPTNDPPDMADDSPHVQLRLYLRDAAFDVELGQIDSIGPVHLTGPAVDFVGQGLRVNYNERRDRIERLEITQGQVLRIKPRVMQAAQDIERPPSPKPVKPTPQAAPDGDEPPLTERQQRRREREERQRQRERALAPDVPDTGPQFYRATLEKDVRIDGPAATITADRLQLVFSLDEPEGTPAAAAASSSPRPLGEGGRVREAGRGFFPALRTHVIGEAPSPQPSPIGRGGQSVPAITQLALLQLTSIDPASLPRTEHPSLAPVDADDVVITWRGPLILTPEEAMPPGLDGADDRQVILTGSPVRITTPEGDTALAAAVDYTEKAGRVTMTGSAEHPLIVNAAQLGELRGKSLAIDQSKGTGYVIGPGRLLAREDAAAADPAMAGGLDIVWADRLDLTFYLDPQGRRDEQDTGLDALRTADFRGDVKAAHPMFKLTSERLAVKMTQPATADRGTQARQAIERLDASGKVHIDAKGDQAGQTLVLDADVLGIDLVAGTDGRSQPTRLTAERDIKIVLPQQTLWSQKLEVGLATDSAGQATVRTLRAEDDVRVDLPEAGVAALAHLMIADAAKDGGQAELFGSASEPARLLREDGELSGQRIVLLEQSRQAHVPGPGSLAFVARRKDDAAAAPTHLTVTWTRGMRFDDAAGTAVFTGEVVAATASRQDRTRLSCEELGLAFAAAPVAEQDAAGVGDLLGGQRQVTRVVAASPDGEAVFLANSYASDAVGDEARLETRFRLAGPAITFTNPDERVTVTGKGAMLLEDYRGVEAQVSEQKSEVRQEPSVAAPAASASPGPPVPSSLRPARATSDDKPRNAASVAITGKGQTLFTWTGSLQLDAKANDLAIRDDVLMIHRTPDKSSVVQLNCDMIAADAQASGGLSAWLEGDAPKPQVLAVKCDGSVRIREGTTTIVADHAHYDGKSEAVDIFGEPRKLVVVQDDDEPLGQLTARKLRWKLATNRFEVIGPGPGRAPVGIQKRVDNAD